MLVVAATFSSSAQLLCSYKYVSLFCFLEATDRAAAALLVMHMHRHISNLTTTTECVD